MKMLGFQKRKRLKWLLAMSGIRPFSSIERRDKSHGFRIHDTYTVEVYKCGLKAGQNVRLKNDLVCRDHRGTVTETIKAESVWLVLNGCSTDPKVVFLQQPDGEPHTWDDDPSIFEFSELVG